MDSVVAFVILVLFIGLGIVIYGIYRILKWMGESYVRWVTRIHEDEKKRYREGR